MRFVFLLCFLALSCLANEEKLTKLKLFKLSSSNFIHALAYASEDNFMKLDLYSNFKLKECYLHEDLRENINKLDQILQENKLKIILYDCFRPNEVQKIAWELIRDERFVANPYKNGSNHSRGIALDLGLADLNGKALKMPTEFDDFSPRARSDFECKESEKEKCQNRELLKMIMQKAGFKGIKSEWWHFEADFKGLSRQEVRQKYPLLELR